MALKEHRSEWKRANLGAFSSPFTMLNETKCRAAISQDSSSVLTVASRKKGAWILPLTSEMIKASKKKKDWISHVHVFTKWLHYKSLNYDMPYFSISSLHCLCVAKQAIAHILISTPVWNCFPRMSQTPWLGVATVRFCRKKQQSNIHVSEIKEAYAMYCYKRRENKAYSLNSDPCTAQGNWSGQKSQHTWEIML